MTQIGCIGHDGDCCKTREQDLKDAERYRWLRDQDNQTRESTPCVSDDSFCSYFGEDLDAIIDAEMGANAEAANILEDVATCQWREDDDGGPWATQCNELFNIENEGPDANGMKFCCFCGKKLVEVKADTDDEVEKLENENL